jgi:hypothetical protein
VINRIEIFRKYINSVLFIALEPVLYNGSNLFDSTDFYLNIILQSDFFSLELICIVESSEVHYCSNMTTTVDYWNPVFYFNGIRGCDYECFFITNKYNYNAQPSDKFKLTFSMYLLM